MSCFLHGLFYAMNLLSAVSLFSLILGSVALPPPRPQASQTSFGLVGYAKAGPGGFGETTGGQGGKIFDVTNDKELQRAIKVHNVSFNFCAIYSCSPIPDAHILRRINHQKRR